MDKPLSVLIRETRKNVVDNLNTSGLHIDIIVFILKDILDEANMNAQSTFNSDIANMQNNKVVETVQFEGAEAND